MLLNFILSASWWLTTLYLNRPCSVVDCHVYLMFFGGNTETVHPACRRSAPLLMDSNRLSGSSIGGGAELSMHVERYVLSSVLKHLKSIGNLFSIIVLQKRLVWQSGFTVGFCRHTVCLLGWISDDLSFVWKGQCRIGQGRDYISVSVLTSCLVIPLLTCPIPAWGVYKRRVR